MSQGCRSGQVKPQMRASNMKQPAKKSQASFPLSGGGGNRPLCRSMSGSLLKVSVLPLVNVRGWVTSLVNEFAFSTSRGTDIGKWRGRFGVCCDPGTTRNEKGRFLGRNNIWEVNEDNYSESVTGRRLTDRWHYLEGVLFTYASGIKKFWMQQTNILPCFRRVEKQNLVRRSTLRPGLSFFHP